ncbi:hypothetical protein N7537_004932 [Penicillium hordei]|uniref:Cytochrome P450 n=1 Tax=Penicillium hordei TaxID=40994 RepID=A0AAD6EC67_9EURO|nr:uncharacterized protein N7537_004932 [Penicillium hordei]KAJ5608313.1 hypothetical protein N7537_004932 [Penicillium hordei]
MTESGDSIALTLEDSVQNWKIYETITKIVDKLALRFVDGGVYATELKAAGVSSPAPWTEIRDLPYLDAVIREALRVNPGIAMIFERVIPEDGFTLPDGRYLPAGTKAGINPFVTNRDFGLFGGDADGFNPDRWLQGKDESSENFQIRLHRMKDTVDLSFGGGGRICMGWYLAMLEIQKLVASLYSSFDYDMPMVIRR